ncbi:hypothetical protein DPMN_103315 [Dreissena polymorpha]|uniref:Uncharacterized protein n=1 Tax=Dreissena polymorpha TaxID=45954 RepID=A0A9D4H7N3_DREPO|nr:hypothetical protein DPMN_103315 [Dreissena polymorpha]
MAARNRRFNSAFGFSTEFDELESSLRDVIVKVLVTDPIREIRFCGKPYREEDLGFHRTVYPVSGQ